MELSVGLALGERYRLVERIGRGGYGEVYRARDESLDRAVAVKVLRAPEFAEQRIAAEFFARFDREARVMASLRHPNIVTVHDRGAHEDAPYVVMELLAGPDLGTLQRSEVVLPIGRVLDYGVQTAAAVEYLHQRAEPVVHRDLKPSNLVLDGETVKVCDFGIAAVLEPDLTKITRSGAMVGTPVYAAPEQCRGEDAAPTWDVFSFGTVLYAMLAGGSPFAGQGGWDVAAYRVQYEQATPIAEVRRDVPAPLAALIEAMMDKSGDARPRVSEVRRSLTELRSGESQAVTRPEPLDAEPTPPTLAKAQLQAAEQLLNLGRYAEADRGFAAVGRSLDAAGYARDTARFAAEFGRVRAGYARGEGVSCALRLVRLLEQAEQALGPHDELVRALRRFQQARS
ncbi:serine/threonine protein kinase [Actinospica durhamensis]|uniref:non-specific serine/threonine protein kinase n=1 Tax=Actinospica durhamensis TaxID=1508375 RepID=A0A941IRF8_9ACTN|nr:serine/threonine-protein kinase [Actinospica durhamensis]MBR7833893.1 serine/threonine protein kinase [Actinospica durhamensis]